MPPPGRPRKRNQAFAHRPYRSTCRVCLCGIYDGDETAWSVRPVTGTVHKACAKAPDSHGDGRTGAGAIGGKRTSSEHATADDRDDRQEQ